MTPEQRRKTCSYLAEIVSVLASMSETVQADGLPELSASLAEAAQSFRQERFRIEGNAVHDRQRSEPRDTHNTFPRGRYATMEGGR